MSSEPTFWSVYGSALPGLLLIMSVWWFLVTALRKTTFVGWLCVLFFSLVSVAGLLLLFLLIFGHGQQSNGPGGILGFLMIYMPFIHDKWLMRRYPRDFEKEGLEPWTHSGIPPYT